MRRDPSPLEIWLNRNVWWLLAICVVEIGAVAFILFGDR